MQLSYVKCQLRAASIDVDRPDDSDIDDADDAINDGDDNRKQCVRRFVTNYLRRDGLLLVRLVAGNVSQMAAGQLLSALWSRHGGRPDRLSAAILRRRRRTGNSKKNSTQNEHRSTTQASSSLNILWSKSMNR